MVTLVRAKTIVTCEGDAAQNGVTFDDLGRIDDAAMIVEDGIVKEIGPASVTLRSASAASASRSATELDLRDCVIVPGFVDAHAHPLFAGDREPDFAARQRGEKAPLGMLYTVEQTRTALLDADTFYSRTIR